jgi:hypothetical protein
LRALYCVPPLTLHRAQASRALRWRLGRSFRSWSWPRRAFLLQMGHAATACSSEARRLCINAPAV